ncbi:MAG: cyclopropane fatty acyl phospholipid synthase [Halofilum sp. (in: g-proteobacteria)]|nr:cyclopropane fatty acyl phospholipid synthase [Halofilum sp. (in: g-proteobacteria)]
MDTEVRRSTASGSSLRERAQALLDRADLRIDGDRRFDMRVHDERLFARVFAQGSLGLGEAYMDGWWDCEQLDEFFHRILRARLQEAIQPWREIPRVVIAKLLNLQTPGRSYRVGEHHYDIGNDLYERMLGRYAVYSCGYWREAESLDEAQAAKMDLICRKLGLEPGMRVLDIGCGWGELAYHMAAHYGAEVVGVTISREQVDYGQRLCAELPVDIRLQDYRALDDTFDRIVSVGMFEHVGYKNYATFMDVARRCLAPGGLFLLHTIGGNRSTTVTDPWIARYIFPNSMIPSVNQVTDAVEGRFIIEDWHNFGTDYDRTLLAWYANFEAHWPELAGHYSERFYRMWRYYLLSCAGSFRARQNQLWQIVLSPSGVPGGYRSVR